MMALPKELTARRQWMRWFLSDDGRKIPAGKSNDPSTWTDFESVREHDRKAFVFSPDDPFCGIDLDDCIDEGEILPWADEILERFRGVAYAEISPSGTGIKLTTYATKPPGSRCSNGKGVECYDRLRFWTITGDVLGGFEEMGDGQAAVDWLIETHLPRIQPTISRETAGTCGGSSNESRADDYVNAARPAEAGQRNITGFSLAGHLYSIVDGDGKRLSDEDVHRFMSRWNVRNTEPLDDRELRGVTESAKKNGTPREDKPPMIRQPRQDVDPSAIFNWTPPSRAHTQPISTPEFPADSLYPPGIIEEVMRYSLARSIYPQPTLALAGAVALLSVITGRKVQNDFGTRTNVYVLGLAPSGAGKDSARKANKDLLVRAQGEQHIGPERIGSSAGLVSFVEERLSILFQLDEIGRMLTTMRDGGKSPHLYNIASVLMQLYSSSDQLWVGDAYADKKKTPRINQPHAVVYGTATPEGFWGGLTRENVSDGLLGRMLVFEGDGYVDPVPPQSVEPSDDLVKSLRWWVNYQPPGGNLASENPTPIVASSTPAAKVRYWEHLQGIAQRRKDEAAECAAVWSRTAEKTSKLALLFAISRQRQTDRLEIDHEDVDRAVRITNHLTRRMIAMSEVHIADSLFERQRNKAFRAIQAGKHNTRSALLRHMHCHAKELDQVVQALMEAEMIAVDSGRFVAIASGDSPLHNGP